MEFLNYVNDDRWAVSRRAGVHVMDVVDEGRLRRGAESLERGWRAAAAAGTSRRHLDKTAITSCSVDRRHFDAGGGTRISVTGATCRAHLLGISGMH